MGFQRYASFAVTAVAVAAPDGALDPSLGVAAPGQRGAAFQRSAYRHVFEYEPKPGYLYVRSRAISSRCNDNYDEFPAEEIKKAYATFIGKPVFVNHHNADHRRARGVIIDAALHEDRNPNGSPDTWVEVLMEVDAIRFPRLAQAVIKGDIDRTSMGTDVAYSLCSVCGNKASLPTQYCKHIPKMKGQRITRTTASGAKEAVLVSEICYGLGFFENSLLVEQPADPTAYAFGVDTRGLTGTPFEGMAKAVTLRQVMAEGAHDALDDITVEEYLTAESLLAQKDISVVEAVVRTAAEDGAFHFTVGGGATVHRGVTLPGGNSYTACGAEGRGGSIRRLKKTDAPITCQRCKGREVTSSMCSACNPDNPFLSEGSLCAPHSYQVKTKAQWGYGPSDFGTFISDRVADERLAPRNAATEPPRFSQTSFYPPVGGGKYHARASHIHETALCRASTLLDTKAGPIVITPLDTARPHPMVCTRCLRAAGWRAKEAAKVCPHNDMVLLDDGRYQCTGCGRIEAPPAKKAAKDTRKVRAADVKRGMELAAGGRVVNIRHQNHKGRGMSSTMVSLELHDGSAWSGGHNEWVEIKRSPKEGSLQTTAYGEVKAPTQVDTLRDDACPVCGDTDSFNGTKCQVCQYVKPPSRFDDPDLEKAKQVDLRGGETGESDGDLTCPNCGSDFTADPTPTAQAKNPSTTTAPPADDTFGNVTGAKAWPLQPGVPAMGHVTSRGGYWHPGPVEGCPKCDTDPPKRQSSLFEAEKVRVVGPPTSMSLEQQIGSLPAGKHTISVDGKPFVIYYDEKPAQGDDGRPVRGDTVGDYEVFRQVGPDDVLDLREVTRQHVSPHGSSGYGNGQAKPWAARQVAEEIRNDLARHAHLASLGLFEAASLDPADPDDPETNDPDDVAAPANEQAQPQTEPRGDLEPGDKCPVCGVGTLEAVIPDAAAEPVNTTDPTQQGVDQDGKPVDPADPNADPAADPTDENAPPADGPDAPKAPAPDPKDPAAVKPTKPGNPFVKTNPTQPDTKPPAKSPDGKTPPSKDDDDADPKKKKKSLPPWLKDKKSSLFEAQPEGSGVGMTQQTQAPNEAQQARSRLLEAVRAQQAHIVEQDATIERQGQQIMALRQGLVTIAAAAGVVSHPHLAALVVEADDVAMTTQQAVAPDAKDNPANVGAAPAPANAGVTPDSVTDVQTTDVAAVDSVPNQLVDVTEPVPAAQVVPSPDAARIQPYTNNAAPSTTPFPSNSGWTASLASESDKQLRLMVALRLARSRVAAGISQASDDDLAAGQAIYDDATVSTAAMQAEIDTLGKVVESRRTASAAPAPEQTRRLVPQAAQRSAPSLQAEASGGVQALGSGAAVNDAEFMW